MDESRLLDMQFMLHAHASEIAIGGGRASQQLGEPVLLLRSEGGISAFVNMCRHRGARLVEDGLFDDMSEIICPYHAWRYDLDGGLIEARHCPTKNLQLQSLPHVELAGLVFVAIDDTELAEFSKATQQLLPVFEEHGLSDLKVASRFRFTTQTNWRLFVENFLECYHCNHAHALLTRSEAFIGWLEDNRFRRLTDRTNSAIAAAATAGIQMPQIESDPDASIFFSANTSLLVTESETVDGRGLERRLALGDERDGMFIYGQIGPLTHFTILPDYVLFFQFFPLDDERTEVELTWLVHPEEHLDQDALTNLDGFWKRTILEDAKLTENVQINSSSRFMRKAGFVPMEQYSSKFDQWLNQKLQA